MKIQLSLESIVMFVSFVLAITISALLGFQILSGIKIPMMLYFFCGLVISLVLMAFAFLKGMFLSPSDDLSKTEK